MVGHVCAFLGLLLLPGLRLLPSPPRLCNSVQQVQGRCGCMRRHARICCMSQLRHRRGMHGVRQPGCMEIPQQVVSTACRSKTCMCVQVCPQRVATVVLNRRHRQQRFMKTSYAFSYILSDCGVPFSTCRCTNLVYPFEPLTQCYDKFAERSLCSGCDPDDRLAALWTVT